MMRILYVGSLWSGGTCLQRLQAIKNLGHEIITIDTEPEEVRDKQKQFLNRIRRKIIGPRDMMNANRDIVQSIRKNIIDVLWLDKALTIKPETLRIVRQVSPQTIITGYSPDDMAAKHNQSHNFLKGLPYYSIYFTTKSYGVEELKDLGCSKVIFIGNAYDSKIHRPKAVTKEDRLNLGGQVGFIGDYERERAEAIYYLAENGIPIRIWGPNWDRKCRLSHPSLKIEGKPLWGDDYAMAICSFDINLVFLRKTNRDLQTTRSIEIPACGGFMLAECTNEHLELFEEGKEAEFFSTKEELLEKVQYYLKHEEERRLIAHAGKERCLKSGYSNHERIKEMMGLIEELREKD